MSSKTETRAPSDRDELSRLGQRLRESWSRLFADPRVHISRPTQLARGWQLEQTLCTRLFQALREEDPSAALQRLPSVQSLRAVLVAARREEAPADAIEAVRSAVSELEEVIARLGGSKANLDTLAARHRDHARERIERTAKQQIFRGAASLFGAQAEASIVQIYVYPGKDEGWCDELAVHGFHRLLRMRPELPLLLGVRESMLDDSGGESTLPGLSDLSGLSGLFGRGFDDTGAMTALTEVSSDPFPAVGMRKESGKLLYTLDAQPDEIPRELDLFFGSLQRRGEPLTGTDAHPRARFAFSPNTPSQRVVFDVFVHEGVWPSVEPESVILRTGDPARPDLAAHSLDRLDFLESIQNLGNSPSAWASPDYPRCAELTRTVHERKGFEPGSFRLYRMALRYPVPGILYSTQFRLPT